MAESIPMIPLEPAIPTVPSIPLEPPITIPNKPLEDAERNPWDYSEIPDFYDRVRSSLNSKSSALTNDVIDYFENAPLAEIKMRNRVPIWRALNETKTQLFQTCIVYMTCYHLCPTFSSTGKITQQTTPSLSLKFDTSVSQEKPCERFLALIEDLIAQILDEEPEYFFGFKVTKEYPQCECKHKVIDAWNKNAFNPLWSE